MSGFKKFQTALAAAIMEDITQLQKNNNKTDLFKKRFQKFLFDHGPDTPPLCATGRERYVQGLYLHFAEVALASETLKDIEFYIGRFPYKVSKISKHRHLQFLVEAYLHEIYILEQRLLTYLKFIERKHKGDPRVPQIRTTCRTLTKGTQVTLKQLVDTRGGHVHQTRFSDKRLDRLAAFDLLGLPDALDDDSKMAQAMRVLYKLEYRKARVHFQEWVGKINSGMSKLLDIYFDRLFAIVFQPDNSISYPSRLKF